MTTLKQRIVDDGLKEAETTFELGPKATQKQIDDELKNIEELKNNATTDHN